MKHSKNMAEYFTKVRKRDGREVPFNQEMITNAILKAMNAASEGSEKDAKEVSEKVIKSLIKKYRKAQKRRYLENR